MSMEINNSQCLKFRCISQIISKRLSQLGNETGISQVLNINHSHDPSHSLQRLHANEYLCLVLVGEGIGSPPIIFLYHLIQECHRLCHYIWSTTSCWPFACSWPALHLVKFSLHSWPDARHFLDFQVLIGCVITLAAPRGFDGCCTLLSLCLWHPSTSAGHLGLFQVDYDARAI
jgi:hypothetical protein